MNNADYHADRTAISKSGLDLIHKSPAHFRWAMDNPRDETPAMRRGSLVHMLVLEPEKFASEYVMLPPEIKVRRGKAYDSFLAECGDRIILTAGEMEEAQRIASAVTANPVALRIIGQASDIERSVFAEDFETGVKTKCRPDIISGGRIYDLKTTRNAHPHSFARSVRSFRYHVQDAFYTDTCRSAGLDVSGFGFIAVDADVMPYQCTVFHSLAPMLTDEGRAEYRQDLATYQHCLESGEWPGYANEYDVLGNDAYNYDEMEQAA